MSGKEKSGQGTSLATTLASVSVRSSAAETGGEYRIGGKGRGAGGQRHKAGAQSEAVRYVCRLQFKF